MRSQAKYVFDLNATQGSNVAAIRNNVQWNAFNTVINEPKRKLVVLTGDRINEFFFFLFSQENVWSFCRAVKKVAIIMKR